MDQREDVEAIFNLTHLLPLRNQNEITKPNVVKPVLREILNRIRPLPDFSLLLGIADDGLPVLLDLSNPLSGPLLVAGDPCSGKSLLLRMLAEQTCLIFPPQELLFAVISPKPREWLRFLNLPNRLSILASNENGINLFLQKLSKWGHSNHGGKQNILLLIDDLSTVKNMIPETQQCLRWIFLRGPTRHIWPIVTLNSKHDPELDHWTVFFRTRLLSRIKDPADIPFLTNSRELELGTLIPNGDFMLWEHNNWVKFWLPTIE